MDKEHFCKTCERKFIQPDESLFGVALSYTLVNSEAGFNLLEGDYTELTFTQDGVRRELVCPACLKVERYTRMLNGVKALGITMAIMFLPVVGGMQDGLAIAAVLLLIVGAYHAFKITISDRDLRDEIVRGEYKDGVRTELTRREAERPNTK